jgi:hypothetical protein
MSDKAPDAAERDTRNRGLEEEEKRQHDTDAHPPNRAVEHDTVKPASKAEDDADDIAHLENPPQTDGPRERSNDGV